jgi:hypothetical protein
VLGFRLLSGSDNQRKSLEKFTPTHTPTQPPPSAFRNKVARDGLSGGAEHYTCPEPLIVAEAAGTALKQE